MTSSYIHIDDFTVHYQKAGEGSSIILCFHGFGEHGRSFEQLAAKIEDYTIIAIDLPFHGQTNWNRDKAFTTEDLINIIKACPEIHDKSFGLLGYSMGGRIALSLYEILPQKV